MKTLLLGLVALLPAAALAQQGPPALPAADLAAIRAVLKHQHDNLNDHRFSEMATYLTPDATTINLVGMWWQGEPAVQYGYQAVFDRIHKGVKFDNPNPVPPTLRVITPEVVLVTHRNPAPRRPAARHAPPRRYRHHASGEARGPLAHHRLPKYTGRPRSRQKRPCGPARQVA